MAVDLGDEKSRVDGAFAGSYAIEGVSVIDLATGAAVPDRTVVITGDKLERVGPRSAVAVPATAQLIDGSGLFLMPGLIDSHVHYLSPATFGPLLIANGVTLVRDMGMPTEMILALRGQLSRGDILGPEMLATGSILDRNPPLIPSISIGVNAVAEARDAVNRQVAAGVDMIKVYSALDRQAFLAILAEGRRLGIKVVGHVPESVDIEEAAAQGLSSSEHLFGFERMVAGLLGGPTTSAFRGMGAAADCLQRLGEVAQADLRAGYRRLGTSGLTVCPTVVVFQVGTQMRALRAGESPRREYVAPDVLAVWQAMWAQQTDLPEYMWQAWASMVKGLQEAGVPLLVGTDLSVPGIVAGFSVHDEMAIWQEAGIAPIDVLRGATSVPARFLGVGDRLGLVEPGRTASVVLLRANPLTDVRNAQQIESVFLRGRYFPRPDLDRLLADVRRLASQAAE